MALDMQLRMMMRGRLKQLLEDGAKHMRRLVSVPIGPKRRRRVHYLRKGKPYSELRSLPTRSKRGEPPRLDTGKLHGSITTCIYSLPTCEVGKILIPAKKGGKPYPLFLELGAIGHGPSQYEERPFIRVTGEYMRRRAAAIMGRRLSSSEVRSLWSNVKAQKLFPQDAQIKVRIF